MRSSTIKIPLYLTICEADEMCPAWYTKRLIEGAREHPIPSVVTRADDRTAKGEYKMVKGAHFDVYPPRQDYEASVTGMCDFLKKHVPV